MSSKPTHSAFIVIEPKEGSERKAHWHEVGAIWPHKNGKGFDLIIPAGISVSGRIVCTERKETYAEPSAQRDRAAAHDLNAGGHDPVRPRVPRRSAFGGGFPAARRWSCAGEPLRLRHG